MNEWEDALAVRDTAYLQLFIYTLLVFAMHRWGPTVFRKPILVLGMVSFGILFGLSVLNMWIWQL